jgi:hypothetical protein
MIAGAARLMEDEMGRRLQAAVSEADNLPYGRYGRLLRNAPAEIIGIFSESCRDT